ncbi:hypothetical protein ACFX11_038379 [Malus domestica]
MHRCCSNELVFIKFSFKKDLKESLHTYVKMFKAEKVKIIGCNDNIASSAFQKGLLADRPLFKELTMDKNLTLVDSYALAEKHYL